ncbi:hypothetical protein HOU67_gp43 [Escherichia phage Skarpretter]|uniref:Uncharacterized protein n=1 Tax=Escherichia phage Skarpretter TaxID=2488654 RepID=A0A3G8F5H7_9CAUD|nr:hypothetical protein HOU67_gp43 [Escherichia phage Skarpretter]AZF88679.1 hypothetical protein [Escherichia phage Skarpretter]
MIAGLFVMFVLGLVAGIGLTLFAKALIDSERKRGKR